MLDLIRKKQKSTLIKFVFWLIIAAFVGTIFLVWGKGDDRGAGGDSVAVSINGTEITRSYYQNIYSNIYRVYQSLYGSSFNAEMEKILKLPQLAYDQILRGILLVQEGDRLGIEVSDQEVVDAIAQDPTFQIDGRFDRNNYVQILGYQRISVDDYEADQKRVLFIGKTEEAIQAGVTVTDADVDAEYTRQNEKVNLSFVRVNPASFEKQVEVSDDKLAAFFAENQEQFRTPVRIALRYLQFEPGRYESELTLEEAEVEKYYRRHRDQYLIEEEVTAAHILIKVEPTDSDDKKAEKRELANKVLEQIKSGEDFAALARKYSDDTASAVKGGELGAFKRGTMVPAFEQTAFSLKPGEVSDLVETNFGLHIIKASAYTAPGEKPLDAVRDQVEAGLRKEKSAKYAYEMAMDAYNINRAAGDIDKAAADFNLGIKETGLFTKGEAIDGIGNDPQVTEAAFAIKPGQLAKPVETANGIYLIGLKERQESRIPELTEVRAEVELAYRKQEAQTLAKQAAEQLLAELKDGKTLDKRAGSVKAKVEQTGPFSRTGNSVPQIGANEALATAAFELTADAPVAPEVYSIGERYIVAVLKEKLAADLDALDEAKRAELKTSVLSQKRQQALNDRIAALKTQAEIIPSAYILSLGIEP